ncbi:MAG TPA: transcription elongation factor GreA [Solirubrobacterales bacterium]|nr:transcription elongation factor GreA [Solirubrobacterales bacterium]
MEGKRVFLTREGLRKAEAELAELVSVRRPEVAERIRVARGFGELSENTEYIEAKNEQALVEGRIATLEDQLNHAVLIEEEERAKGVADLGAKVTVQTDEGKETYSIVGPAEADPAGGMISNESPLGRALLGHKAGEEVEWEAPAGTSRVKILKVS